MRRKTVEPISIKFIFFLVFMFALAIYYVFREENTDNVNYTPTYEEMLEYHDGDIYNRRKKDLEKPQTEKKQKVNVVRRKDLQKIEENSNNYQTLNSENTDDKYGRLLDSLKLAPYQSSYYVNIIVDQLLRFKGYPQGIVKVVSKNINKQNIKDPNSYLVANFDIRSGKLNLDERILGQLDSTTLIAVLAHELDHFDKIASVCRYMGVDEFEALLNRNGIYNVDTPFWRIASSFGKTKGFNGKHYEEALERFISQNQINQTGAYSDFYKLSENVRNPLEISAYKESDYVFNHYGITVQEGQLQKLVKKFNDIDWAIYNKIQSNNLLKDERISLFDYFYAQAILSQMPDLESLYNSNIIAFWNAYKTKINSSSDYTMLITLLNNTETRIKKNITEEQIIEALQNKIDTLRYSKLDENSFNNLEKTIKNYLNLTKKNNIIDDEHELLYSILLICLENKLFKNSSNTELSLYYLEMPEFLVERNNIKNKKQKYLAIYNNPAFKRSKPAQLSEENYLIELLNKNRLNVN